MVRSYNVINVIIVPTLMAPLLNIFVMIFNCWVMMLSFKWLCLHWGPCPLSWGTRYASIIHWEDRCSSSIFLFTWKIMLLTYFPSKRWNATFINCSSLDEKGKSSSISHKKHSITKADWLISLCREADSQFFLLGKNHFSAYMTLGVKYW